MPGVEEVKLHIAASVDDAERAVVGMRSVVEQLEETLNRLRIATAGSVHPRVADAIGRVEQAKQKARRGADPYARRHSGRPVVSRCHLRFAAPLWTSAEAFAGPFPQHRGRRCQGDRRARSMDEPPRCFGRIHCNGGDRGVQSRHPVPARSAEISRPARQRFPHGVAIPGDRGGHRRHRAALSLDVCPASGKRTVGCPVPRRRRDVRVDGRHPSAYGRRRLRLGGPPGLVAHSRSPGRDAAGFSDRSRHCTAVRRGRERWIGDRVCRPIRAGPPPGRGRRSSGLPTVAAGVGR